MKVLQISNYMYPNIGGIEQTARDIANSIACDNVIEQKIICFNENAMDGDCKCRRRETVKDEVDGIEVIRCGCITKLASQSISLTYPSQLKIIMDGFKPDIIIFHYPNPYVSTLLMKYLKRNIRFILYWHLDIVKQKTLRKLFDRQTMKLLERADKVIATSPNYIEGSPYLNKYKGKCKVIPSCINQERLEITQEIDDKIIAIKEQYKNRILCFTCGRHVPYKGLSLLIQASNYLTDEFAICIGGSGELTEQLKKEAYMDNKITFLGRISDSELVAYMRACDIFCFPSITKNEAFGLALAEGMYCGKPTVTFTIPGSGVNFVSLDGVTGIECPNANSKEYSKAIKQLAYDESLREEYGNNARKRVLENFTTDIFSKEIREMISEYA